MAYAGQRIVVQKTYAQMAALIAAEELNPFLWYKITDRGDNGLVFRAAAANRLESDGVRYMLCPATYAVGLDAYDNDWIGVWNATKQLTATEGQLCIWNGLVWTAGAVLSGDSPSTESSGWTVIPKATFTNSEYIEMIFNVIYDFDNDWINKQWDTKGNEIGCDFVTFNSAVELPANGCDITDWNKSTDGNLFFNNDCIAISNNNCTDLYSNRTLTIINNNCTLGILENIIPGDISYNECSAEIKQNNNSGVIGGNVCNYISNNKNNGNIVSNSINSDIKYNFNNGQISQNVGLINDISYNYNNDDIISNTVVGEISISIYHNINNGKVTGTWDADVTDAVVDKTGTA